MLTSPYCRSRTRCEVHSLLCAALVALALAASAAPASAQLDGPRRVAKPGAGQAALGKVSTQLLEARRLLRAGEDLASVRSRLPSVTWREERMEVEVRLRALPADLLAQLEAEGLQPTYVSARHARVVGVVEPARLEALAAFAEVATIHPLYGYRLWTGSVVNQADASINADDARSTFGVDGSGVEIGVLSDSFHDVIGGSTSGIGCSRFLNGSTSQGSADLPANVRLLDNGAGGGTDEGAAMAELIHDLAPGSPLAFHSVGASEAEFADGIDELRACGARVIVDDVLFFAEPMFQDGPVAQAAQAAFDAGVPYYSSAGNSAGFGADESYADFSVTDGVFGEDFHDFGGGDRFAAVTVPGGCGVTAVLQWNDPFDGTLGPGASDDFDLLGCTSASPADCVFGSTNAQGCSFGAGVEAGDPLEILGLTNGGGPPATAYFAVNHFCGDENAHFRIAILGSCNLASGYVFEAGIFDKAQIYGHAAALGADAVAAVFYGEIDTGGGVFSPFGGQIDVEPFSSLGGDLPFYFDAAGDPLAGAPIHRFKPQIAAPDGSNTSFFGSDIGFDADTDPNFFGTSAAAPHAAAVAALLLEASPSLAANGVRQVLAAAALDIEAVGVDELSGDGLVDAFDTVQTVSLTGSGCVDEVVLSDQDVDGTQFFRACESITAGGDYRVTDNGDLTFRAGDRIVIEDGFSISDLGRFVAQIDPSL